MNKVSKFIIQFRNLVILIIAAITVFMGIKMMDLKINSDIINSLPEDDPAAVLYKEIGEKYQGSAMGVVIIKSDSLYSNRTLSDINTITELIQNSDGIESVNSLTNVIDIHSDEYGIEVGHLVDTDLLPYSDEQLKALKKRVEEQEMYQGAIVSTDHKATIIVFTMSADVNQEEVGNVIREEINALQLDQEILYGGLPMMMMELSDIIFKDMLWLIPTVFLVLLIILFLSFKSIRGGILPLISVGIAITWTLGLMSILGYNITMIGGIIPVVLFAVGCAYAIHVINHVTENQQEDYHAGIVKSLRYLIVPVFLSSLTTVFGFISFIFGSYLTMIKDFGIFAAVGTFFSFLLALTFVPAVLSFAPPKKKKTKSESPLLNRYVLQPISKLVVKHPKYILATWGAIVVLGIVGTFLINRSTNLASFFPKKSETRLAEETLQDHFGGSAPVFVRFKGDVQDPEFLHKMKECALFMKKNPYISNITSVVDLVEQMNDAMGEGVQIPDDRAKIEQLWFLLEGQEIMGQLVSDDLDEALIQTRFASISTIDTQEFIEDMEQYIAEHQTEDCQIEISGIPSVYVNMDKSLLKSQLGSLEIAIVLVLLLVTISLKSLLYGVMGITPILATVVTVFGFMGFTGIALDVATVSVASIVLGIGIDYSIHTMNAFNYYYKETGDIGKATESSILIIGKSILINAISVGVGFSILIFSHLIPMRYMGLLIALSMLISSIGALTLLPVLINMRFKRRRLKGLE